MNPSLITQLLLMTRTDPIILASIVSPLIKAFIIKISSIFCSPSGSLCPWTSVCHLHCSGSSSPSGAYNHSVYISNAFFFPFSALGNPEMHFSVGGHGTVKRLLLIHQLNCILGAVFPQKKDVKGKKVCTHLVGYCDF